MSNERKILKALLLQEELDLLEKLKHKFLSKEQFTQEVSDVLAGAIKRSSNSNNRLKNALKEPIQQGIHNAFIDNKQSIIDSILPIMGQLIRKTVTNSIKQFVADINRTLELGFSAKAIKWRWQAFRSDKSFAEMVFQKTIRYQVEEMFFVDRETGLLIEYAGTDELVKNKDAISSMLTAIQDFIGDSLQLTKSELVSAEIGDNLILITTGPHAYLATVVKGSPTERLKEKLQQLIETIHADFGDEFIHQENFRNLPELSNVLKNHLITKGIDESSTSKKTNFYPWIIGLLLLLFLLGYHLNKNINQFNLVQDTANATTGLFVKSIERTPDGFLINGLVDPLADLSQLQNLGAQFNTNPFISLDSEMVHKRAEQVLKDFPEAKLSHKNKQFLLTGTIQADQLYLLKQRLLLTPGIVQLIDQTIVDRATDVKQFFNSYSDLSKPIQFQLNQQVVHLSGAVNEIEFIQLKQAFKKQFTDIKLNTDEINIIDSNTNLIQNINNVELQMPNLSSPIETNKLELVINSLQKLQQRNVKINLSVIGKSDCNDKTSDLMSQKRLNLIIDKLTLANLNTDKMKFSIKKCQSFDFARDRNKRTVLFKVE
jgi:OOP family OmpA-OmpF porin